MWASDGPRGTQRVKNSYMRDMMLDLPSTSPQENPTTLVTFL